MTTLTFHVVLNKGFQSEAAMHRIATAAGLTNVNEERARFFDFSIITAQGAPSARQVLEKMPEVKSVQLDGEKRAFSSG